METENGQFMGNYIKDPVLQERAVSQMKSNPSYGVTIQELKNYVSFDEVKDLKFAFAYQFDALDVNEDITVNEVVVFESEDRKIRVEFFKSDVDGDVDEKFLATVIRSVGEEEIATAFEVVEGVVDVIIEGEFGMDEIPALELNLPEVEGYEPGVTKTMVGTEGFQYFCLYWDARGIRYQHCGRGCGVSGPYGGGKLVNRIDGCCAIHDDCWKNKRRTRNCCDKYLVKCAARSVLDDYPTYLEISAYFNKTGKLCKE